MFIHDLNDFCFLVKLTASTNYMDARSKIKSNIFAKFSKNLHGQVKFAQKFATILQSPDIN